MVAINSRSPQTGASLLFVHTGRWSRALGGDFGECLAPRKKPLGLAARLGPSSWLMPLPGASPRAMGAGGRGEEKEDLVTFQVGRRPNS